jgi:hypothetical protein
MAPCQYEPDYYTLTNQQILEGVATDSNLNLNKAGTTDPMIATVYT